MNYQQKNKIKNLWSVIDDQNNKIQNIKDVNQSKFHSITKNNNVYVYETNWTAVTKVFQNGIFWYEDGTPGGSEDDPYTRWNDCNNFSLSGTLDLYLPEMFMPYMQITYFKKTENPRNYINYLTGQFGSSVFPWFKHDNLGYGTFHYPIFPFEWTGYQCEYIDTNEFRLHYFYTLNYVPTVSTYYEYKPELIWLFGGSYPLEDFDLYVKTRVTIHNPYGKSFE